MSDTEAAAEAERRGLTAWRRWGWCHLTPTDGGPFASRATEWEEAFARLDARSVPAPECSKVLQRSLFEGME